MSCSSILSPFRILALAGLGLLVGCDDGGYPAPKGIQFKDNAPANTKVQDDLTKLPLVDAQGEPVDLKQYQGKKNLILVVTRGATGTLAPDAKGPGSLCVYCTTQTARLMANYQAFKNLDTEVLVVFPVARDSGADALKRFADSVKREAATQTEPPFPLALDLNLKAVDQLGIRADLSKPATYILDKQSRVRYAYVGASLSDRPSVKALLAEVQKLNQAGP